MKLLFYAPFMFYASFNKYLCIICQEHGGSLHDMEFITTAQRMLYIAEKYDEKRAFYRRMNHITSANGVKSI